MKRLVWIGATLIAVALLGLLAYVAVAAIPEPSQQLRPGDWPLQVALKEPLSGHAYPVSGGLSVWAEAAGQHPLTSLELWVDGELVETYKVSVNGLYLLSHEWTWMPESLGQHTLYARATDSTGRQALSNVVRVQAVENPGFRLLIEASEGQTLVGLAAEYEVSVAQALAANPDLAASPEAPLEQGEILFLPMGGADGVQSRGQGRGLGRPAAQTEAASPSAPGRLQLWFQSKILSRVGELVPPVAPELTAKRSGCSVDLTIHDQSEAELGFFVYRLDPGASSFQRIANLGPRTGAETLGYQDSDLFGSFHYYVASYNGAGEMTSELASVEISEAECAAQAGLLSLSDLLSDLQPDVDRIYLYLKTGSDQWQRYPAESDTFFSPDQQLDLAAMVPASGPRASRDVLMRGEAWGWNGDELIFLGDFENRIAGERQQAAQPEWGIPSTSLELRGTYASNLKDFTWIEEVTIISLAELNLRWSTGEPATEGLWQVASVPFGDGPSLYPPGLLLSGRTRVPESAGAHHEFVIDMSVLGPEERFASEMEAAGSIQQEGPLVLPVPFAPPGSIESEGQNQELALSPLSPAQIAPQFLLQLLAGEADFYVRILPIQGNQVIGDPSNEVRLDYEPVPHEDIIFEGLPKIPYEAEVVEYQPVHFPNSEFEYCVEIVENPYFGMEVPDYLSNDLIDWVKAPVGELVCPDRYEPPSDDILSDVAGLIEELVDFVSEMYDKLDAWVKEWVDRLNPLCIQARFVADAVGEGEKTVDGVCKMVASMAVEAVKAYFGIPPSLPNYDELVSMGKDYLVDVAADELEAKGVPCPDKCKDLIRQGVDATVEHIEKTVGGNTCYSLEQARKTGYEPLCPPQGVVTKPDPRGRYAPGVLRLNVRRKPGITDEEIPASCNIHVQGEGTTDYWIGDSIHLRGPAAGIFDSWQGERLEGVILSSRWAAIPRLAQGESVTVPLFLNRPAHELWLPGHEELFENSQIAAGRDDWLYYYEGADLEIALASNGYFPENMTSPTAECVDPLSEELGIQDGPLSRE